MARTSPSPIAGARPVSAGLDWSALLAQHRRWLRTVVISRLGDSDGAEEVLQEVSLAAVRQKSPLADPTKAAPWLYRLAVVQTLLYRRACGRRRKLVDRVAQNQPGSVDADTHDPLGWLLADERGRLVREALGRLPARDAELLMLKYTEDWNYRQLAEHLGISMSAVETRLHRARARLRSQLIALNVIEVER
jgi:RNA polymerase sigma-70 factor (ECF subfamily)